MTPAAAPPRHSGLCQLIPAPLTKADSLWIVTTDSVVPSAAPYATTSGERVVFPLLYSTPIVPNCDSIVDGPSVGIAILAPDRFDPAAAKRSSQLVADSPPGVHATWPQTTGRFAIHGASDTALDLVPRQPAAEPRVHVSAIDAKRARDALDAGADVVVTSDPSTIEYAGTLRDVSSVPLAWDWIYILIERAPRPDGARQSVVSVQAELASDALRVEARPATDSAQWTQLATCQAEGQTFGAHASHPAPPVARIVYNRDDNVARALSERLVALADDRAPQLTALETGLTTASSVRALGLGLPEFRAAIGEGRDAAYVIALPVNLFAGCRAIDAIRSIAPWLTMLDDPSYDHVIPLVETRARALVRRHRVGLALDGAGNVFLQFSQRPPF